MFDTKPQIDINISTQEIADQISNLKSAVRDKTNMEKFCHKQDLEFKEKQWQEEKEIKDRVDISKKEYLDLLEENKLLKENLEYKTELLKKIFYNPLTAARIDDRLCNLIFSGEVAPKCFAQEDVRNLSQQLFLVFDFKDTDLWKKGIK